jgi:hypothetical protein
VPTSRGVSHDRLERFFVLLKATLPARRAMKQNPMIALRAE